MTPRLRVMVDADVLFAGSASPSDRSASTVVLRMSDLTLIDGVAREQVVLEAERNLSTKIPVRPRRCGASSGPASRSCPTRSSARCRRSLDAPMRRTCRSSPSPSASGARCSSPSPPPLAVNVRDYQPGHEAVEVVTPGVLVQRVRRRVSTLDE